VFVNSVATDIVHLTNQKKLIYYRGDYNGFLKAREEKFKADLRAYEAQQLRRKHIEDFITTFRTEKKGAAQNAKVNQVLSRMKVLEKMEMIPDPREEMKKSGVTGGDFRIVFPDCEPVRNPLMIETKGMSFKYNKVDLDAPWLLHDVNVRVDINSRIGIVGTNVSDN